MKNYIQSASPWGQKRYAGETMAVAGCGPTAVADVVSLVCDATPDVVADYITSIGGASNGYGTYWEAIPCAVQKFGMECKQINSSSKYGYVDSDAEKEFLNALISGEWDCGILLMGNGFFCKNGHYIAVEYVNDEWYIKVLDVAYSPRSVMVKWTDIAPANAAGNAIASPVAYFRGKVKVFYVARKKKEGQVLKNKTTPTTYLATFRQIEPGMKDMPEIYIVKEILKAQGYYKGELNFVYDKELETSVKNWQKKNRDWISKEPLAVDRKWGPACWRRAMHMKGSPKGAEISFLLREKEVGETGTTCRFTQHVEKARGWYSGTVDNSNGPLNAEGNDTYCQKANIPDPKGKITVAMLKDMCGGR